LQSKTQRSVKGVTETSGHPQAKNQTLFEQLNHKNEEETKIKNDEENRRSRTRPENEREPKTTEKLIKKKEIIEK